MKKTVGALCLALAIGSAHAGLTVNSAGQLATSEAGTVTYTLTGYDAAHFDVFFSGHNWVFDRYDVNQSFSTLVNAGALRFSFDDLSENIHAANGNANRINMTQNGEVYYLGFDDNKKRQRDYDFNDMTVRVSFTPAVPEPESYAMFLAGLGLMGFIALRRRGS